MCRAKCSRKDCKRCLLIVSKIGIICYIGQRPSSLIINFKQVIKSFLVSNVYFTFFLTVVDCTFSLLKSKFMEKSRSNIAYVAGF